MRLRCSRGITPLPTCTTRLRGVRAETGDDNHGVSKGPPHRLCVTSICPLHGAVYLTWPVLSPLILLPFSFRAMSHILTIALLERYAVLRPVGRFHSFLAVDRHPLDTQQEYLLTAARYCATDCGQQSYPWSDVIVRRSD